MTDRPRDLTGDAVTDDDEFAWWRGCGISVVAVLAFAAVVVWIIR